ncbi:hypothetical protein DFP72DRAFT_88288 [Ephemerocybe angulata]|uniref:Uncharacterized protein n=1 Tax=Ephemerocybe angulata TaxID=980116 RepID=A0A8H6HCT7_9AGAR|nr:hypothetical protein DFP72DRAFT_88288 [Tulosesus angulatus]
MTTRWVDGRRNDRMEAWCGRGPFDVSGTDLPSFNVCHPPSLPSFLSVRLSSLARSFAHSVWFGLVRVGVYVRSGACVRSGVGWSGYSLCSGSSCVGLRGGYGDGGCFVHRTIERLRSFIRSIGLCDDQFVAVCREARATGRRGRRMVNLISGYTVGGPFGCVRSGAWMGSCPRSFVQLGGVDFTSLFDT